MGHERHYSPQRPDEEGVHLGARAHTDTNAFTLLAAANISRATRARRCSKAAPPTTC
jgi:hypothetical protein